MERGVIQREGKLYAIDSQWVRKVEKVALHLKSRTPTNLLSLCEMNGGVAAVSVNSIEQLHKALLGTYKCTREQPNYAECNFLSWPLLYLGELLDEDKFYAINDRAYTVSRSDTPLDRWCRDLEVNLGMETAITRDCAANGDLHVIGDYVIANSYPAEELAAIMHAYKSVKEVRPANRVTLYAFMQERYRERHNMQVTVVKDPGWAKRIRENVLKSF